MACFPVEERVFTDQEFLKIVKARKSRKNRSTIRYAPAPDLQLRAEAICRLIFPHISIEQVRCFRSWGSAARRTIARCHGLAKIMQLTLNCPAHYAIEFIGERFDTLPEDEQNKIIIHELMHIPKNFGGGFRRHHLVTEQAVTRLHLAYKLCVDGEWADSFAGRFDTP